MEDLFYIKFTALMTVFIQYTIIQKPSIPSFKVQSSKPRSYFGGAGLPIISIHPPQSPWGGTKIGLGQSHLPVSAAFLDFYNGLLGLDSPNGVFDRRK